MLGLASRGNEHTASSTGTLNYYLHQRQHDCDSAEARLSKFLYSHVQNLRQLPPPHKAACLCKSVDFTVQC